MIGTAFVVEICSVTRVPRPANHLHDLARVEDAYVGPLPSCPNAMFCKPGKLRVTSGSLQNISCVNKATNQRYLGTGCL